MRDARGKLAQRGQPVAPPRLLLRAAHRGQIGDRGEPGAGPAERSEAERQRERRAARVARGSFEDQRLRGGGPRELQRALEQPAQGTPRELLRRKPEDTGGRLARGQDGSVPAHFQQRFPGQVQRAQPGSPGVPGLLDRAALAQGPPPAALQLRPTPGAAPAGRPPLYYREGRAEGVPRPVQPHGSRHAEILQGRPQRAGAGHPQATLPDPALLARKRPGEPDAGKARVGFQLLLEQAVEDATGGRGCGGGAGKGAAGRGA